MCDNPKLFVLRSQDDTYCCVFLARASRSLFTLNQLQLVSESRTSEGQKAETRDTVRPTHSPILTTQLHERHFLVHGLMMRVAMMPTTITELCLNDRVILTLQLYCNSKRIVVSFAYGSLTITFLQLKNIIIK